MSEPLLTGKPSLLCQGNFEVRIRALEEHLKEIETKLQTITRLDLKPTELMKLPKEERDEILNMTFHPESKMTELEAENGEVCDRCGEVINRLEDEVVYNICASCFATNEGNKSYQVLEQELADAKAELQKISFAIGCDGHPEDVIGNIRELKAKIKQLKKERT